MLRPVLQVRTRQAASQSNASQLSGSLLQNEKQKECGPGVVVVERLWLRALVTFADDSGFIPSTHVVLYNHLELNSSSRRPTPPADLYKPGDLSQW